MQAYTHLHLCVVNKWGKPRDEDNVQWLAEGRVVVKCRGSNTWGWKKI